MCGSDVVAVDPRTLSDEALGEHVAALEVLIRRAQAAQARAVRVFEARDAADRAGFPSARAWLCANLGLSDREARSLVGLGRAMVRLPRLAAAFAEGATTAAHVRVASAASRALPSDVVESGDEALVSSARVLDARRFGAVVDRWVARVAPAAFERDAERRFDSRWFSISATFGGMHSVSGMLDPEAGTLLSGAIAGLVAANPRDDVRTPDQQRADALADLTRLALAGDPNATSGPARAELVVHVPGDTLATAPSGSDVPAPRSPYAGAAALPAEVDGAGPVSTATAERLACDAAWRRLLLDAARVPVELGRATRTVPPSLRKFVALRDGGCRYPGCTRGPAYCDAHHVVFWRDGGATDASNLVLLCRYHHHLVHERRHGLAMLPDATVRVTLPNGHVLSTHPRTMSVVARL